MATNFGKTDFETTFNPITSCPIDARTYFESYEEALAAAQSAVIVNTPNVETSYYIGQILSVVDPNTKQSEIYTISKDSTGKITLINVPDEIKLEQMIYNATNTNTDAVIDLYNIGGSIRSIATYQHKTNSNYVDVYFAKQGGDSTDSTDFTNPIVKRRYNKNTYSFDETAEEIIHLQNEISALNKKLQTPISKVFVTEDKTNNKTYLFAGTYNLVGAADTIKGLWRYTLGTTDEVTQVSSVQINDTDKKLIKNCTEITEINNVLYIGTGPAGILRSEDYGETVRPTTKYDLDNNIVTTAEFCSSIYFDKTNNTYYAGFLSTGIYSSADGISWYVMKKANEITTITIDNINKVNDTLIATGETGMYYYDISDETWKTIEQFRNKKIYSTAVIPSINPIYTDIMFTVVLKQQKTIWYSYDGLNWKNINLLSPTLSVNQGPYTIHKLTDSDIIVGNWAEQNCRCNYVSNIQLKLQFGYVTLMTDETIQGQKTFSQDVIVPRTNYLTDSYAAATKSYVDEHNTYTGVEASHVSEDVIVLYCPKQDGDITDGNVFNEVVGTKIILPTFTNINAIEASQFIDVLHITVDSAPNGTGFYNGKIGAKLYKIVNEQYSLVAISTNIVQNIVNTEMQFTFNGAILNKSEQYALFLYKADDNGQISNVYAPCRLRVYPDIREFGNTTYILGNDGQSSTPKNTYSVNTTIDCYIVDNINVMHTPVATKTGNTTISTKQLEITDGVNYAEKTSTIVYTSESSRSSNLISETNPTLSNVAKYNIAENTADIQVGIMKPTVENPDTANPGHFTTSGEIHVASMADPFTNGSRSIVSIRDNTIAEHVVAKLDESKKVAITTEYASIEGNIPFTTDRTEFHKTEFVTRDYVTPVIEEYQIFEISSYTSQYTDSYGNTSDVTCGVVTLSSELDVADLSTGTHTFEITRGPITLTDLYDDGMLLVRIGHANNETIASDANVGPFFAISTKHTYCKNGNVQTILANAWNTSIWNTAQGSTNKIRLTVDFTANNTITYTAVINDRVTITQVHNNIGASVYSLNYINLYHTTYSASPTVKLQKRYDINNVIHNYDDETIEGQKTFIQDVIIPETTENTVSSAAITKSYIEKLIWSDVNLVNAVTDDIEYTETDNCYYAEFTEPLAFGNYKLKFTFSRILASLDNYDFSGKALFRLGYNKNSNQPFGLAITPTAIYCNNSPTATYIATNYWNTTEDSINVVEIDILFIDDGAEILLTINGKQVVNTSNNVIVSKITNQSNASTFRYFAIPGDIVGGNAAFLENNDISSMNLKIDNIVYNNANQTVTGQKTFTQDVIIPNTSDITPNNAASTKQYVKEYTENLIGIFSDDYIGKNITPAMVVTTNTTDSTKHGVISLGNLTNNTYRFDFTCGPLTSEEITSNGLLFRIGHINSEDINSSSADGPFIGVCTNGLYRKGSNNITNIIPITYWNTTTNNAISIITRFYLNESNARCIEYTVKINNNISLITTHTGVVNDNYFILKYINVGALVLKQQEYVSIYQTLYKLMQVKYFNEYVDYTNISQDNTIFASNTNGTIGATVIGAEIDLSTEFSNYNTTNFDLLQLTAIEIDMVSIGETSTNVVMKLCQDNELNVDTLIATSTNSVNNATTGKVIFNFANIIINKKQKYSIYFYNSEQQETHTACNILTYKKESNYTNNGIVTGITNNVPSVRFNYVPNIKLYVKNGEFISVLNQGIPINSSVVHKTNNETISGRKTFTDPLTTTASACINYVNIYDSQDNTIKYINLDYNSNVNQLVIANAQHKNDGVERKIILQTENADIDIDTGTGLLKYKNDIINHNLTENTVITKKYSDQSVNDLGIDIDYIFDDNTSAANPAPTDRAQGMVGEQFSLSSFFAESEYNTLKLSNIKLASALDGNANGFGGSNIFANIYECDISNSANPTGKYIATSDNTADNSISSIMNFSFTNNEVLLDTTKIYMIGLFKENDAKQIVTASCRLRTYPGYKPGTTENATNTEYDGNAFIGSISTNTTFDKSITYTYNNDFNYISFKAPVYLEIYGNTKINENIYVKDRQVALQSDVTENIDNITTKIDAIDSIVDASYSDIISLNSQSVNSSIDISNKNIANANNTFEFKLNFSEINEDLLQSSDLLFRFGFDNSTTIDNTITTPYIGICVNKIHIADLAESIEIPRNYWNTNSANTINLSIRFYVNTNNVNCIDYIIKINENTILTGSQVNINTANHKLNFINIGELPLTNPSKIYIGVMLCKLVHTTGTEVISGNKTFTDEFYVTATAHIYDVNFAQEDGTKHISIGAETGLNLAFTNWNNNINNAPSKYIAFLNKSNGDIKFNITDYELSIRKNTVNNYDGMYLLTNNKQLFIDTNPGNNTKQNINIDSPAVIRNKNLLSYENDITNTTNFTLGDNTVITKKYVDNTITTINNSLTGYIGVTEESEISAYRLTENSPIIDMVSAINKIFDILTNTNN